VKLVNFCFKQRNSFGSLNSLAVLKMMGRGAQRGGRGMSRGGRGSGRYTSLFKAGSRSLCWNRNLFSDFHIKGIRRHSRHFIILLCLMPDDFTHQGESQLPLSELKIFSWLWVKYDVCYPGRGRGEQGFYRGFSQDESTSNKTEEGWQRDRKLSWGESTG
jgi:hypothetical protein